MCTSPERSISVAAMHDVTALRIHRPAIARIIIYDHVHGVQFHAVILGMLLDRCFAFSVYLGRPSAPGLDELRIARAVAKVLRGLRGPLRQSRPRVAGGRAECCRAMSATSARLAKMRKITARGSAAPARRAVGRTPRAPPLRRPAGACCDAPRGAPADAHQPPQMPDPTTANSGTSTTSSPTQAHARAVDPQPCAQALSAASLSAAPCMHVRDAKLAAARADGARAPAGDHRHVRCRQPSAARMP